MRILLDMAYLYLIIIYILSVSRAFTFFNHARATGITCMGACWSCLVWALKHM
ncbi:hypothetical protein FB446DRAFT_48226 [Lentinula raphanica]|nr:hypothetical protein FB446DRAFT_48226 [Lentinula raphanica]